MSKLDPDEMPLWLQSLWPRAHLPSSVLAGINEDDCAVIQVGSKCVVLSTDFLNAHPIAEQLGIATTADLGRLLVISNLSDLCGTGARPIGLLTAITLPRGATTEEFQQIMLGVRAEAAKWRVPVIGGDTKLGNGRALLAVAIGEAEDRSQLFLKNRGKAGDSVWLSGEVGSCNAAALALSETGLPDDVLSWARAAVLSPELPLGRSRELAGRRIANAGTDISDGLGASLKGIADASSVGLVVWSDAIPVHGHVRAIASRLKVEPWSFAFACGGDAQFVVTVPEAHDRAMQEMGFCRIGHLVPNGELSLTHGDGRTELLPVRGHRDARGLTFVDEIKELLSSAVPEPAK